MAEAAFSKQQPRPIVKQALGSDDWVLGGAIGISVIWLSVTVLVPLYYFFSKSVQDADRHFVGFANFIRYFNSPGLVGSIGHSFFIAVSTSAITMGLAFIYAYALTRSRILAKGFFRVVGFLPMLVPSVLPAISFVYLFGTQGLIRSALFGHEIYGPIGIVMGEVFYTFPHAIIILITALRLADARLYDAAAMLGAGRVRTFLTVTLPGVKYGVISAAFVVFSLTITDFGVPKVIGGRFEVLATDVYSNVVGVQDMEMAAVVGVILLLPAAAAFAIDRLVQARQVAALTPNAVPLRIRRERSRDLILFCFCSVVAVLILGVIGMAVFASLVKFWPYNLSLTLAGYDLAASTDLGWTAYWNSLVLAAGTATIGTIVIFLGAYVVEKARHFGALRSFIQMVAMVPMAVPGMVLGLAYIFFFNRPGNPLGFLYGTMLIMVLCTIAHFYTVGHLTAVTALKQLDASFEAVSASLKVPVRRTLLRVTVPICLPAILDIGSYLFVNAMTTVSAIVFLYFPRTMTASIQMLFQDDNGNLRSASALGVLILLTSAAVRVAHWLATRRSSARARAWSMV
jgi:iron(III) transport system permease protein